MQFADIKEAEPAEVTEATDGESAAPKRKLTRSTVLLGGLVLAAVGGLWLMHARGGPTTVEAASTADQAIDNFLGDGRKNMAHMQAMLNDTEKVVDQFKQFPAAAQAPLEELQKNPFSETQQTVKTAASYDARQSDRDAALEKARKLQLQSILFGQSQRSCMLGGKFYGEGDSFDGFEVQKINQNSVIVKHGGYRFELKLQR
ncbi:MAG TPA: general secretion pathway protein GspB [Tepidisphaeraceae bacterium]|jgi:hypothetical protein